jgi:hypothetical protein
LAEEILDMLHVTFDTNLLIDIEEKRTGFEKLLEILALHNGDKIRICIPAIAASEKLFDAQHIPNYTLFENYLSNLGIKDSEELMPLAYWDMCFFDHCLFARNELVALDHSIHKILFPNIEPDYGDFRKKRSIPLNDVDSKWRNAKIDVQMLWCHIYHKKDIFITRDNNFKRKSSELNSKLGKVVIMTPVEFLKYSKSFAE